MNKRSKRILIGMAVIVGVPAVAYAVTLALSLSRLRQAYATLAKDGRPMNAADLIPPEVPDEQNAAVLYEKAASLFKSQPTERKKNQLEYLGDLSSRYVGDSIKPEDLPEFRQLMGQEVVTSALAIAEQGTLHPACRLKRDYQSDPLSEMPIIGDMRNLVRILGARACLEAQANEPNKAWETVRTQLRLAKALRSDPSFMGQLVHWQMTRSACSTIQRLCEVVPPTEDQGLAIAALLGSVDRTAALVHALDGERLLRGEWFFNLPEDQLRQALRRDPLGNDSRLFVCVAAFRPRLVADHATYLRTLHTCTQWVMRPYSPQDPDASRQIRDMASSRFLTRDLAAMVFLCKEFLYRALADVSITRAGLGVLQYRRDHGTFPQTLEAVGLKGLIDPYTEDPLNYRAEGDGFIVYSVGEDLKDNGGVPRQGDQKTDYDLVWRFPGAK
jgi:hypothetical protein